MLTKTFVKAQMAADQLRKDVSGASLIEYSLLIGLITVAVVATIVLVGTWVSAQWTALDATLP